MLIEDGAFVNRADVQAILQQVHGFAGATGAQSQNGMVAALAIGSGNQHRQAALNAPCGDPHFAIAEQTFEVV